MKNMKGFIWKNPIQKPVLKNRFVNFKNSNMKKKGFILFSANK